MYTNPMQLCMFGNLLVAVVEEDLGGNLHMWRGRMSQGKRERERREGKRETGAPSIYLYAQ